MTTREALTDHYMRAGLLGTGESVDDRLHDRWVRMRLFGRRVPVKPLLGHQQAFLLHDVHHLVTGYGTRFRQELELASWELGSGGCGWYVLFWVNRLNAFVLGLVCCPRRTLRALRAGYGRRNLYRLSAEAVLGLELDAVRTYVGLAPAV